MVIPLTGSEANQYKYFYALFKLLWVLWFKEKSYMMIVEIWELHCEERKFKLSGTLDQRK